MPDNGWVDYNGGWTDYNSDDGWKDYSSPKSQPQEQSWGDWLTEQAISTVPTIGGQILGGIGGGLIGGMAGGVGAIPGALAGSRLGGAAGAGLGELGRQVYKGEDINPWMIGTESALGAWIPGGVSRIPGLGSTIREVGEYALKGGVQGAFQGAVGSVPRHIARTGNWETPNWQNVVGDTVGGGIFGAATGAALGTGNVIREHYTPGLRKVADADYSAPIQGDLFDVNEQPITRSIADLPAKGETSPWSEGKFTQTDIQGDPSDLSLSARIGQEGPGSADLSSTYLTLRQMLGRDPTMAELDAAVARSAGEGDVTGRVAPFLPTKVNKPEGFWESDTTHPSNALPPVDPEALQKFKDETPWLGMDPANQLPVRIPGRDGAAEWPPRSGNVVQPVENAIPDQPNLPGVPVPVQDQPIMDLRAHARDSVQAYRQQQAFNNLQEVIPFSSELPARGTDEMSPEEINRLLAEADELDARASQPQVELIDPESQGIRNNASGESSASWEAMSRQRSMQQRGEQYVTVDRAGNVTPLITTDAVDVPPPPGSTKGIITRDGQFRLLDGQGRPPKPEEVQRVASSMQPVRGDDEPLFQRALPSNEEQGIRNELRRILNREATNEEINVAKSMYGQGRFNELTDFWQQNPGANPPVSMWTARGDSPSFAKVEGGGLSIDVDNRRAGVNLTKDYTGALPGIMNRESVQNAIDAVKDLGMSGKVNIRFLPSGSAKTDKMEVYDNGSGLDETALAEKLVRLFATGKQDVKGATGGKGIGSASYILGGAHFEIETVAVDSKDGKKYRIIAGGTPDQFYDTEQGSDWSKREVPPDTPTGTQITVQLRDDQELYDAREMMNKILSYSRDKDATITVDPYDYSGPNVLISDLVDEGGGVSGTVVGKTADDKLIGEFNFNNSDIKVQIPKQDETQENNRLDVHYLNSGMYQFTDNPIWIDKPIKGFPKDVIVNITPRMDEQDDLYPFINTREDVKKNMRERITDFIKANITNPALDRRKNRTQELYDSMPVVNIKGTKRKPVIFDPGMRMTPQEVAYYQNSPMVHAIVRHFDSVLDDILKSTGRTEWADRLEGVGLVLDPGMHGVHIPNPATGKSTILFNPNIRMEQGKPVSDTAFESIITALHEAAHIGKEAGIATNPIPVQMDLSDPRYVKFYQSYMQQIQQHGDVGWRNTGHGMDFVHRLGEVYAKYGPARTFDAADTLESILTGGKRGGEYSPEVQELLRIYIESRGRAETTEDLLSGTGVKQSNTGSGSEGNVPGDSGQSRKRTNWRSESGQVAVPRGMWKGVKQATGWGQGGSAPTAPPAAYNWLHEAMMLPSAATTTLDLSLPGRQGLSQITTPQFWKAFAKQFKGFTEAGFDAIDQELRKKQIFQPLPNANGRPGKSLAQEAGIELYTPASRPGPRAQGVASRWLETGGSIPYVSAAYRNTAAVPIRASNRMALTFLNVLRAETFETLVNRAEDMAVQGMTTGKVRPGLLSKKVTPQEAMDMHPYNNLVLAREIGDFVNTATGQAPLKTHLLPYKNTELNLQAAASVLNATMFSPGFFFSRLRLLNPSTYAMASPFVRKQYMKSVLSLGAAWFLFTEMLKKSVEPKDDRVQVSNRVTSADFGKVRVGDARMDVGAGALQFLTQYGRMWEGGTTSSATGEWRPFGKGFRPETQWSNAERFLSNKLNPTVKFAYDLAHASEYNPFHVYDRMAQLVIPLYIQDLNEIGKENPDLLPILGTAALFGAGTQIYSRGESVGKLVAPEDDWLVTGGGFKDLFK